MIVTDPRAMPHRGHRPSVPTTVLLDGVSRRLPVGAETVPDMGLDAIVSRSTLVSAAMLGVLAVAAAPLLTVRRLRAMNVPDTPSVVE